MHRQLSSSLHLFLRRYYLHEANMKLLLLTYSLLLRSARLDLDAFLRRDDLHGIPRAITIAPPRAIHSTTI